MSQPEDIDGLSDSLLKAIKPSLKAPATSVLCSPEELQIVNNNGEYVVTGYASSQNSYGAMISTDFTARARYSGGVWSIGRISVGIKQAKRFGKSFAVNYIAISIFVAVMGLVGYYLLTLFIG